MRFFFLLMSWCYVSISLQAQNNEVFSLLDLDYPGLEQVKSLYLQNEQAQAAQALLEYYRNRTGIVNPAIDLDNITISKREQQWADDALKHTFYVHDGYQPSFNYGKDINWKYWPVQDNELRWQLHRHKWFTPMGKAYRLSKDEKYAKEWVFQFCDWIKKNPLKNMDAEEYEMTTGNQLDSIAENVRFAWRPLEVSHRLQDQVNQFVLFISSPSFTADFLTVFLGNYYRHAQHVLHNYSAEGNHLLFEAQRMLCAGTFFPELKAAKEWRKSGIDILNREIRKQVYADGGQYELDLHYHVACIGIFSQALRMATANGFRNEFPDSYISTVEKMIVFYMNLCFPDYTNPCFSDSKRGSFASELGNYRQWQNLFPENEQIRYFATQGKEGKRPDNLSKGFLNSGFFAFRSGWEKDALVMVLKAGPKGEWHCQPDNGTFELWFNGRNLFPDSGSYIYAGDEEVMKLRNWFRQTSVHNTLTLDDRNLETTESMTRYWNPDGAIQVLVTENPSYEELRHRRSVFFVDNSYFVIVDEAMGKAAGQVALHYQLSDGKVNVDRKKMQVTTLFEGESNLSLHCFGPKGMTLSEEEGWYSTAYRVRKERTAVAFSVQKKAEEDVIRYVTVICPHKQSGETSSVSMKWLQRKGEENSLKLQVVVDGKKQVLEYQL